MQFYKYLYRQIFIDSYNDAKKHCDKLRPQPPRVYNEQRLLKLPIPVIPDNEISVSSTTNNDIEPDASVGDEENLNASQFSSNDQSVSNSTAGIDNDSNQYDDVTSSVSESTTTGAVFLPEHTDDPIAALVIEPNSIECDPIKEEPEFELDEGDQVLFDDFLADIDEQCDSSQSADGEKSNGDLNGESEDELILLEEDKIKKCPMPMAANLLGLMKREKEPISGSLAFNEKVNL